LLQQLQDFAPDRVREGVEDIVHATRYIRLFANCLIDSREWSFRTRKGGIAERGRRRIMQRAVQRLRAKPLSYWIVGAVLLALTIVGRPVIEARLNVGDLHDMATRWLLQSATNRAAWYNVRWV